MCLCDSNALHADGALLVVLRNVNRRGQNYDKRYKYGDDGAYGIGLSIDYWRFDFVDCRTLEVLAFEGKIE